MAGVVERLVDLPVDGVGARPLRPQEQPPLEELIPATRTVRRRRRIRLVHRRETPTPLRVRRPELAQDVAVDRVGGVRMPDDDSVPEQLEAPARRGVLLGAHRRAERAAVAAQAVVLRPDRAVRLERLVPHRPGVALHLVVALRIGGALDGLGELPGAAALHAGFHLQGHFEELVRRVVDVEDLLRRSPALRRALLEDAERVAVPAVQVVHVRLDPAGLEAGEHHLVGDVEALADLVDLPGHRYVPLRGDTAVRFGGPGVPERTGHAVRALCPCGAAQGGNGGYG